MMTVGAGMPSSSSGSGHLSFKEATGIRLPLGVVNYERKSRIIVKEENKEIMEVNILALIATALFILVPTAFLLIIYVKTVSQND
ncbi:hypothetical protein M5K25_028273 [Dendrobium thyrsiflorum]|uniref:PSII-M n=1 Tax=Dendrobium thyrsiflorum TaxID=117978 RepID=A0ABD0TTP4_DENTH